MTTTEQDVEQKNIETSRQEVNEFMDNPPQRYFAYVNLEKQQVTTWMGDPLSVRIVLGRKWRDNFGGTRQSIWFVGVNGLHYSGTYFVSSGDYCRVRVVK